MYVMKRLSGGRGEYELAEAHGRLHPADLLEHELLVGGGPLATRPTLVVPRLQGGKQRLRIRGHGIHFHRQVAALMMLPKPIRDESRLPANRPIVREGAYAVRMMDITTVELTPTTASLILGSVEFENALAPAVTDSFPRRMTRVFGLHRLADSAPPSIGALLRGHRTAIDNPAVIGLTVEGIVRDICHEVAGWAPSFGVDYPPETDPVSALEEMLGSTLPTPDPIDLIPKTLPEVRRRVIAQWRRWAVSRGSRAATFRDSVIDAYRSTCLVCGLRFAGAATLRAGVDAAHILPWAKYDLDDVRNGVCLCKNHHWAFDQGLLRVAESSGVYRVDVTAKALRLLEPAAVADLRRYEGPVGADRLPSPANRPGGAFLEQLYEELDVS